MEFENCRKSVWVKKRGIDLVIVKCSSRGEIEYDDN